MAAKPEDASNTSRSISLSRKRAQIQKELDEANIAFKYLSGDQEKIDANSLEVCMKSINYEAAPGQIESMIAKLDKDGKGYVTIEEFFPIMKAKEVLAIFINPFIYNY